MSSHLYRDYKSVMVLITNILSDNAGGDLPTGSQSLGSSSLENVDGHINNVLECLVEDGGPRLCEPSRP